MRRRRWTRRERTLREIVRRFPGLWELQTLPRGEEKTDVGK
jgi:hypothetical protein